MNLPIFNLQYFSEQLLERQSLGAPLEETEGKQVVCRWISSRRVLAWSLPVALAFGAHMAAAVYTVGWQPLVLTLQTHRRKRLLIAASTVVVRGPVLPIPLSTFFVHASVLGRILRNHYGLYLVPFFPRRKMKFECRDSARKRRLCFVVAHPVLCSSLTTTTKLLLPPSLLLADNEKSLPRLGQPWQLCRWKRLEERRGVVRRIASWFSFFVLLKLWESLSSKKKKSKQWLHFPVWVGSQIWCGCPPVICVLDLDAVETRDELSEAESSRRRRSNSSVFARKYDMNRTQMAKLVLIGAKKQHASSTFPRSIPPSMLWKCSTCGQKDLSISSISPKRDIYLIFYMKLYLGRFQAEKRYSSVSEGFIISRLSMVFIGL